MTTLTAPDHSSEPSRVSAQERRSAPTSVVPVIGGFHPDPSICRVGDDYYVAHSSFEYSPAVPIWHSTDLVSWRQIGNALPGRAATEPGERAASKGIYAPTLRHHDGRFWLITTDVSGGGRGQVLSSATEPSGPWTAPVLIEGLVGIDPDLAWDEKGSAYVTYCSTDQRFRGIVQARVDLATATTLEEPRLVWRGTGLAFPEAPHLYQHDGWWYLLIAEGGTERGHGVSVARSRDPEGPFEAAPSNPLLSHRSTTHPVQNTGHADLVEMTDGRWAAVYLGVRARGQTPMFHVNGRETFLAGVDWVGGWPAFDESRFTAPEPDWFFHEPFDVPSLHPRWVSPGAALEDFVEHAPGGGVLVRPVGGRGDEVSALMTRVPDPWWRCDLEVVTRDGSAAVLLRLDDRHWSEVRLEGGAARAVLHIGPLESCIGESESPVPDTVTVRVRSGPSVHGGPDDVTLSVLLAAGEVELGTFDGRYLSTEVAGGFTGRVIGVRAISGTVHVLSVAYTPVDTDGGTRD